ncbi:KAP family NTPase [Limosilactobacillus balticus]|uniref:AAA family ATPase n=1 Tax=Limosilactobacillus balticus TaxID=2759747 RepID=UPI001E543BD8|nr:AAA family ATPase [Limosilactobacillus balticus]MCD7137010.1 KAP family NTPase [Limosilactobacillus balticus]
MAQNPFNPTFGDIPKIYLDTDERAAKLVTTIKESDFARSFFITGVRGSGKTSFMTQVEHELNKDKNCFCIDLVNDESLLNSFIDQLGKISKTKLQQLVEELGLKSINFKDFSFNFNKVQDGNKTAEVAKKMMENVQKNNHYVLVVIDEVDNSQPIRSFAQIFNELKRHGFPIFVLMTGLPDLIMDVQNENKLTFLLRSEKEVMTPLQNSNMVLAYERVFHCNMALAQKMTQMVKGYSYGFQFLGYLAFEEMEKENSQFSLEKLVRVTDIYKMRLFDNAYNKIYSDLSEMDQKYLIAVLGNKRLKEVAQQLDVTPSYASQYRRRAIARHLVRPGSYGHVQYILPFFNEFIRATQDPDSIYFYGLE